MIWWNVECGMSNVGESLSLHLSLTPFTPFTPLTPKRGSIGKILSLFYYIFDAQPHDERGTNAVWESPDWKTRNKRMK